MKKYLIISIFACLICIMSLASACQKSTPSTTSSTIASTTASTTAKSTSTTASTTPQKGGTLTVLIDAYGVVFGNPKEYTGSKTVTACCLEGLANFDEKGNLVPVLATSWDIDSAKNTITYHLRQGVKFHDGTDFNAEAVKWNIEQYNSAGKIAGGNLITSIDVVDNYIVRLNLKSFSAVYMTSYTWFPYMFSPTYIQKVGLEASRTHPVGTGPFKFESYQTNANATYVRNDNYWRPGLPYLDRVVFQAVPDAVSLMTMMAAGQGDVLYGTGSGAVGSAVDLKRQGFNLRFNSSGWYNLHPDSANTASPLGNRTLRMAMEYAINRPALSSSVGYGLLAPTNQFSATNSPTYDPNYVGRPYDVAKAKQYLAEAGYTTGFTTDILCDNTALQRDICTAIQGDLAVAGITAKLNMKDGPTIQAIQFGKTPWNNALLFLNSKGDPGAAFLSALLRDYGVPGTYVSLKKSDAFLSIVDQIGKASSMEELDKLGKALTRQASDDIMTIPLVSVPFFVVFGNKVHTSYGIVPAPPVWDFSSDWKEK